MYIGIAIAFYNSGGASVDLFRSTPLLPGSFNDPITNPGDGNVEDINVTPDAAFYVIIPEGLIP